MREIMRAVALTLLYQEHVEQATPFYAMSRERFANWRMSHYRGWPSCDWPRECGCYVVPNTVRRMPSQDQIPFSLLTR